VAHTARLDRVQREITEAADERFSLFLPTHIF
jgi:hypothetical protein